MEEDTADYLTRIPDELKIAIFGYLDTFDVIQVCDVSASLENLTFDKDLISKIRLCREYRCTKQHLNNFLKNKCRAEIITSLNINCMYWIPAVDLRNCVSKLFMLECLYAVDTKLSFAKADCLIYSSLSNLKALALSFEGGDVFDEHFPITITNLYVHTDVKSQDFLEVQFIFYKMKFLQELWVIDLSKNLNFVVFRHIYSTMLRGHAHPLEKVTMMVDNIPADALSVFSSDWIIMFKDIRTNSQMCLEKFHTDVNPIYNLWNHQNPDWDTIINRLKCELPFGQSDARKLILKQTTLDDIWFEELNMSHTAILCSKLLKFTLGSLLVSPNMRLLKKLSINICLCEQYSNEVIKPEPLFKRARVGVSNSLSNQSTLEKIIGNSPFIEELEIWECDSVDINLSQITHTALSSIQNLKYLKKLTLHGVPPHLTGKYLIDICKGCRKLESLRIQTSKQNNNLNNYLSMALPHTTALKDLRYEQYYIPVEKIMNAFNSITDSKLQRVLLKCKTIEKCNLRPFETFVSTNPQLRFLCLIMSEMPNTVIREISKTINRHGYSPEKVFVVTKDESMYTGRSPIPHVHKIEMLRCYTWVSVLDIFNGFSKC